jgi:methionine-rich copper-binding protein CopC
VLADLSCTTLLAAWIVMTAPVYAHAQYASSTPGKGARLTTAPAEVTITFTQEIQKIAGTYDITVNKDRGLAVTSGPAVVSDGDRTMMSVPLEPGLADGRYVVRWKNVSDADGDPLEGAFSFYLNYEPNTVDLENDAQLAEVGAEEETPASGDTPVSDETPSAATPTDGAPTAAATPGDGAESDEDDDSGSTLWVIVGAVGIGLVAGVGAFAFARSRRR